MGLGTRDGYPEAFQIPGYEGTVGGVGAEEMFRNLQIWREVRSGGEDCVGGNQSPGISVSSVSSLHRALASHSPRSLAQTAFLLSDCWGRCGPPLASPGLTPGNSVIA